MNPQGPILLCRSRLPPKVRKALCVRGLEVKQIGYREKPQNASIHSL